MKVFIRTDASVHIGSGHVMRCIVLAEQLRKRNAEVIFICRKLNGNFIAFLQEKGFPVQILPDYVEANENIVKWMETYWQLDGKETIERMEKRKESFDWLIIDHYGIDAKWERFVKPFVKNIMVIDDLANRPHHCNLLLDQNLYPNMEKRYQHLVSNDTKQLLGLKYLLLRDEFKPFKNFTRTVDKVKKILISFGGSDATNETLKAIKAIHSLHLPNVNVDVVIGYSNPHHHTIHTYSQYIPYINIHENVNYIATLMKEADIAIGSGGSSTWERCFLQLPTLTIETAPNQSEILTYLSQIGAVCHLGKSEDVDEHDIAKNLFKLIYDDETRKKMIAILNDLSKRIEENAVLNHLFLFVDKNCSSNGEDDQGESKDVR